MSKKLDEILVVDIEATSWMGEPPPGETPEIIEIGLCVLDVASARQGEKHSFIIAPQCSRVSDHCQQLTTLTQEQVEAGMTLAEACDALRDSYQSRQRPWASWGEYDRRTIQRECQEKSVEYPFGPRHINIKTLFALVHGLEHEVELDRALAMLGWPLEGTHHRGDDDSWNIARILGWLLTAARAGGEAMPAGDNNQE